MFKTALGLILAGILFGDGLGLIGLFWVMFRDRKKDRVFWFLSFLFLSIAFFLLIWLSAGAEIPIEARTQRYRVGILVAASVLALGIWPAVLHMLFGLWQKQEPPPISEAQAAEVLLQSIAQIVRDEQLSAEKIREVIRDELESFFKNEC